MNVIISLFSLARRNVGQLHFKNEDEHDENALVESDFLAKDNEIPLEKTDLSTDKHDT